MPRILKRDIRRDFAKMITNVYNSGDGRLVEQFFNHFCTWNFQSVLFSRNSSASKPAVKFTTGLKPAIFRTNQSLSTYPDLIFQLEEAQIIRRPDFAGSLIHLKMKVNCTPFFMEELQSYVDCNNKDVQAHHRLVHCYGHFNSDTQLAKKSSHNEDFNVPYVIPNVPMMCDGDSSQILEEAEHILRSHELEPCWICCQAIHNKFLETPVSYCSTMDMKLVLDEEHRICRMEFHVN